MEINVKRLLKDLFNADDDLRALSAMTLIKVEPPEKKTRDEILHALMKATRDKNVAVRFFSRKAIAKLRRMNEEEQKKDDDARPSLEKSLDSENYEDRLSGVMQISREEKSDFKDRLLKMLQTETHDFVKASLISCLKKFLDKTQVAVLSPFMKDPDNRVRSNTIEALEYLKAEDSIPLLFPALEDADNRIRAVAAKALASFGEEKVFAVLKKMLSSTEEWMKISAIYSLAHIQSGEAITLLINAARTIPQQETRIKAIISLANYRDLASYGFLKHLSTQGEEPFKGTAVRALKLYEEKFGPDAPTHTMIPQTREDTQPEKEKKEGGKKSQPDLTATVSKFFRPGKEEAVDLSQKAAISFALTDLQKEAGELAKESGRVVFEIYQQGDLKIPELLTISHEILRMNYFIQKYSDEEEKEEKVKSTGFFAQLKNLFSKVQHKDPKAQQVERFTQKREDLFKKLGEAALQKMKTKELTATGLDAYFQTFLALEAKIAREKSRMA